MLWKKAIPVKHRIKEIEQGLKREFMETIQDPYETQKIIDNLVKSANEEILITFPSKQLQLTRDYISMNKNTYCNY